MGLFARQVVGIDLGHASVKAVGLKLGRQPLVTGFAEVPVEAKYLAREGGEENPEVVAAAIRQALKGARPHPIGADEVYVSVSEDSIFRKILELPASITDEELPQVVRTESVEYLPDDIDTLELDYQVLTTPSEDATSRQVMVVAVSKKLIARYLKIFATAKLSILAVDPKPSALGRAIVSPQEKEPVIIMDIGSETSSVSVYINRMVWVTGAVNSGASIIIDSATGQPDEGRKVEKLKRLAGNLSDELEHVLKFYNNRASHAEEIKEVRVSGGGSLIEGIEDILQDEIHPKIVLAKPIITVPDGLDRHFFGALGSAIYPLYDLL